MFECYSAVFAKTWWDFFISFLLPTRVMAPKQAKMFARRKANIFSHNPKRFFLFQTLRKNHKLSCLFILISATYRGKRRTMRSLRQDMLFLEKSLDKLHQKLQRLEGSVRVGGGDGFGRCRRGPPVSSVCCLLC